MAMSGESIRAQALRCAAMLAAPEATEDSVIAMASRFEAWIAAGASLTPSGVHKGPTQTDALDLPLTPGEMAMLGDHKKGSTQKRYKGQGAHTPPCYAGTCPACDMARARGDID